MHGFPIPPIGKLLGSRMESHDPKAGVLRVSFPTKPEYASPDGAVMGGIAAAFLDGVMVPLIVAATGGAKFSCDARSSHDLFHAGVERPRAAWLKPAWSVWAAWPSSHLRA
jgi:acyl-coenzyme A thioesterase PaaI-like protein